MSASTEKRLRAEARAAGTDKKTLAAQEAAKKAKKEKLKWTLTAIGVVIFVAVVILANVFNGTEYKYNKTTALTVGSESFSPAEMNYFYAEQYYNFANNYGSYISLFGLDTSNGVSGLGSQSCAMMGEGGTWRDYFLDAAKASLKQYVALKEYAVANGISLTQEELDSIDSQLASVSVYATYYGYSNVDGFLAAYYGTGVNSEVAKSCMQLEALASKAYSAYAEGLAYTDEELEEYYAGLNGASDKFDYLYYYVKADTVTTGEGDAATTAATDETMAAAKATAEEILYGYETSEVTAASTDLDALNDAVAASVPDALATERTGVTGSSVPTGISAWLLDSSRVPGEATILENEGAGYYVVVFEGRNDNHYNTVSVRHILIKAVADENGEYTEAAKAEAYTKAAALLDQWKAGEATEDSFAALANENSEDGGSNTNGGLYEGIYRGEMVENFEKFCFDEGHKPGDTGIVYGESSGYAGWHVMYYVGEGALYSNIIAEDALKDAALDEWLTSITTAEMVEGSAYSRIG